MIKYKYLYIILVLTFVLFFGGTSIAQDGIPDFGEVPEKKAGQDSDFVFDPILGTQKRDNIAKRNNRNDRYAKTTYQNISKMYWAIYKHNLSDDEAIDKYLRINECDLWEKYYHMDFQWEEIREATRKIIAKSRHTFPMKFEILLPLSLGRYNIEREAFEIKDVTKFQYMKKIDIALADQDYVCHSDGFLEGYPGTTILILDRPFHLVEIPVKPELAQLYIKEAEKKYANLTASRRIDEYERQAYLRVLVSFNSYVNTVWGAAGVRKAVVHAKIDSVEVYADSQYTKPLYIKDLSIVRKRRQDRVIDDTTNNDIERALQELLASEEDSDESMMLQ